MALIAQAATLEARIPFMHFFDGFRTSHEVNKLTLTDDDIRAMIDDDRHCASRRALNPDNPSSAARRRIRTSTSRAARRSIRSTPRPRTSCRSDGPVRRADRPSLSPVRLLSAHPTRSGWSSDGLGRGNGPGDGRLSAAQGEKVGVVQVRLFRPFSTDHLLEALPKSVKRSPCSTAPRNREPWANRCTRTSSAAHGGPLNAKWPDRPHARVIGGRYGLSSKEFTPAMVQGGFDELTQGQAQKPLHHRHRRRCLAHQPGLRPHFVTESDKACGPCSSGSGATAPSGPTRTRSRSSATIPIYAQGYFVYDSKKSGSQTVSHLRFGAEPIRSPYLIQSANFIGCHQVQFRRTGTMCWMPPNPGPCFC
jgi:pyruvate-ferredoxin/flavodoxin oxidoreductase